MEIFNSVPPPPFVSMDLRLWPSPPAPVSSRLPKNRTITNRRCRNERLKFHLLELPRSPPFFMVSEYSVGPWVALSLCISHTPTHSEHDSEHDKKLSHAAHDVVFLTRPIRRDHDDIVIRLPPEGGAGVGRATFAGRKVCLLGP